ncbi:MAG: MarR family winged helix-turn-helix transcriptional regulator [Candidatus Saccharimonadales bacterium]|jgi:DNA-binding MarR family transcriptional regulator
MDKRSKDIQDLFATYAVVQRMMHTCLQRAFDELGVAPSQLQLLHLIKHNQPVSLKTVAAELRLTPGAITQQVESVVKAGYVNRNESSEDRRITVASLTPSGSAILKRLERMKQELLTKVVADLNDEELEVFLRVQQKMLVHLEESCAKVKK